MIQPVINICLAKQYTRDKLIALIAMTKKDINTVICDLIDAAEIPELPDPSAQPLIQETQEGLLQQREHRNSPSVQPASQKASKG